MLNVILVMTLGILFGIAFRSKKKMINVFIKSTLWIIFLLLFFLGLTVGYNDEIMQNLGTIGFRALQFSLAALLGSLSLSWVVYRYFFKSNKS